MALVVAHANAGDVRGAGSVPGPGRSPEGGHGNPLQDSCLENSTDRGAWQATAHRIAKSGNMTEATQHAHIIKTKKGKRYFAVSDPTQLHIRFSVAMRCLYSTLTAGLLRFLWCISPCPVNLGNVGQLQLKCRASLLRAPSSHPSPCPVLQASDFIY